MKKYNLSSTDFDKVIKIIEAHPEFSLNYGKELILCEISPSTLNTLINCSISNSMRDSFKKIPIENFNRYFFLFVLSVTIILRFQHQLG